MTKREETSFDKKTDPVDGDFSHEKIKNDDVKKKNDKEINSNEETGTEKVSIINENSTQSDKTETQEMSVENKPQTDDVLGLSTEISDEKIRIAMESQSPKKKKRSTIVNLCLLLVNLCLMFFIVKGLIDDVGDLKISDIIQNQGGKLWWLLGGIAVYALYIFVQTMMYKILIREFSGKNKWGLAYNVAVSGKYYDNITPFAVGGQPFQILKLHGSGLSAGVSTSIPIMKMIINNSVNAVLCLVLFIFCLPKIPLTSIFNNILLLIFEILAVIGLIISVIVVLVLLLVSSGNLLSRSVLSKVLRIGYKLKIVKNYRKSYKKLLNQVAEYKTSMSYLKSHKKLLFKLIILSFFECLTYASLPYFVIMALSTNIDIASPVIFALVCVTKYYICFEASSFIPLPGGTGLIEIAFIALFSTNVGDNIVWALLCWRFLSYYIIILHGFVNELTGIFNGFIKNRKSAKNINNNLQN